MTKTFHISDILMFLSDMGQLTLNLEADTHGPGTPEHIWHAIQELSANLAEADLYLTLLDPTCDLAKQLRNTMQDAHAVLEAARAEID